LIIASALFWGLASCWRLHLRLAEHGPPTFTAPWHLRYHRLASFQYRALRPLLVNTAVEVLADTHADAASASSSSSSSSSAAAADSKTAHAAGTQRVKLWVRDKKNPAVVYMEGVATFEPFPIPLDVWRKKKKKKKDDSVCACVCVFGLLQQPFFFCLV
jgi:hypothetical protein